QNRDAHLPALATSLHNHASYMSETGRRTEAVPVSEEALRLYSELAEQNRDAHLPALATSLHNHASYMSETGRRTEAVLLSEEALRLRRELAEQNRDAYLPDLATSLWVRAEVLDSDVENLTAAIAAAEEAVVLFEELVSVLPQAFEERLLAVRNLTAKLRRQRDRGAGPGQGGLVDLQPNAPCSCGSGKKYKRCHGAPS
ncbi:tetratricopeptide repeat protein, partial [Thermopolyspora sp. NPDC052614]|uniref:tetratricopeptide repeat protein n=1 Tax=Thermopolyspora sp. NPDC052614 TaxID=3155682 RepID=UPI00341D1A1F